MIQIGVIQMDMIKVQIVQMVNTNGDNPNGDGPNGDSPTRKSSKGTETSINEYTPPKPIHRSKTHIPLSQELEQRILRCIGFKSTIQKSTQI